jgi:hypothetical protein
MAASLMFAMHQAAHSPAFAGCLVLCCAAVVLHVADEELG